jgi:hypothetical protein
MEAYDKCMVKTTAKKPVEMYRVSLASVSLYYNSKYHNVLLTYCVRRWLISCCETGSGRVPSSVLILIA